MFLIIRSRHPSHDVLRKAIRVTRPTMLRLGSKTETLIDRRGNPYREINTVDAVTNSANKLLMKEAFTDNGVRTADWFIFQDDGCLTQIVKSEENLVAIPFTLSDLPYPVVAKHKFGSRGTGNYLLNDEASLRTWMNGKTLSNYIFEKFYNYNKEYRLHITKDGCFYTCRKMLKTDVPADQRWFRNDSNSVWMLEENPLFDKPVNWQLIEEHCVKALLAVGLDIGAVDLRVQSTVDRRGNVRENSDFIVLEINSAASLGQITTEKYIQKLNQICAD